MCLWEGLLLWGVLLASWTCIQFLPQDWEVLSLYFFKYTFCSFFLASPSGIPITRMLSFLKESDSSHRIYSLKKKLNSLSSSSCIISRFLSSMLLILSPVLPGLFPVLFNMFLFIEIFSPDFDSFLTSFSICLVKCTFCSVTQEWFYSWAHRTAWVFLSLIEFVHDSYFEFSITWNAIFHDFKLGF